MAEGGAIATISGGDGRARSGWRTRDGSVRVYLLWVLASLVFLLQPLTGIAIAGLYAAFLDQGHGRVQLLLIALLATWIGLINVTKEPVSDLAVYFEWLDLSRTMPLLPFLAVTGKEPGYTLILHTLGNSFGITEAAYIFFSTAVGYVSLLSALARLGRALSLRTYTVVAVIIAVGLFPPLFNISGHLLRQFGAGALVTWFFVEMVLLNRRRWWLLVIAFLFFHASAALFFPLAWAAGFRRLTPSLALLVGGVALAAAILLVRIGGGMFAGLPVIGYVLERAAGGQIYDPGELQLLPLLLLLGLLVLSLTELFRVHDRTHPGMNRQGGRSFQLAFAMLAVLVLTFSILGMTEMAERIFFYVYFLGGVVGMIALQSSRLQRVYAVLIAVIVPLYFLLAVPRSPWNFAPMGDIVADPAWRYLLGAP
jgi:hypothetical protein